MKLMVVQYKKVITERALMMEMLEYVKITTFTRCRNVSENRRRRSRHEEIKMQRTIKNLPGKEGS